MAKIESISLINKDNNLSLICFLNSLLVALIILKTHPLSFETYYSWIILLIPLALYMSLISLDKFLKRFDSITGIIFFHGVLALFYLLVIILITLTGGASSNYKIILLLPVLFYSLQFGSWWGYGASVMNMMILITFYVKGENTAFDIESNLTLFPMFFLVGWLAGKGGFLEKIKYWSSGMTLRDGVTGLYNKQYLYKKLNQLLEIGKSDLKIGLILIEPYRYSEFRKIWGFYAGNIMLKDIAKSLSDFSDRNDVAVHYGEGKFAVITQEKELARIIGKGDKLMKELNNIRKRGLEDEWNLPVAVGVSIFPDHDECSGGLQQKAEEALARAKAARGNRVQVYYSIFDRISGGKKRYINYTLKKIIAPMQTRDRVIYGHSERVFIYTQLACRKLGLTGKKALTIESAAFLHDIGKIELQEKIPVMQGPLAPVEQRDCLRHTLRGADILGQQGKRMHNIIPAVRHHHESYDGTGYPDGLKGDAIPLGARIIAVGNYFDHITLESPYFQGKLLQEGINFLLQYKNKYFDPLVVEAFVHALDEYEDLCHIMEWPKGLGKIVPCGYTPNYYILGGHYAHYYSGDVHFLVKAVYCIAAALYNEEKCLYIMDEQKEKFMLQQIEQFVLNGVKISDCIKPSQLEKVIFPEYLSRKDLRSANFQFVIKRIMKSWLDQAEREHFSSVRLIIDQSFLNLSSIDLKTWEKMLTQFIKKLDVVVVCYFDIDVVTNDVNSIDTLHHSPIVTVYDEGE